MNNDYDAFIKYLSKGNFTLEEARKIVDNPLVEYVNTDNSTDSKYIKFTVKITDGDVYHIRVKK